MGGHHRWSGQLDHRGTAVNANDARMCAKLHAARGRALSKWPLWFSPRQYVIRVGHNGRQRIEAERPRM
jgi:hypothetical protein